MRHPFHGAWAAVLIGLMTSAWGGQAKPALLFDFDGYEPGKPPPGFSTSLTGNGSAGEWLVREESSGNKVLAQMSADKAGHRFPVCVYQDLTARDIDVSARFNPVSGEEDRAAGIVWRYKDENNYYVVRANALENNVVLYKVQNGKRSDLKPKEEGILAYGKKAEIPSGQWSTLRIMTRGSLFEVSLNGRRLFEAEDTTFPGAGRIGLWTKADSVTLFDDLAVTLLDEPNTAPPQAGLDAARLESILGIKGTVVSEEFKIALPQKDLAVMVDGFSIVPAMGLTSWVAFTPHEKHVMAMGDLALLEDEVGPVQKTAIESGLSATAIHNHFLRDKPKVMFMHIGGMGEPEELAKAVRRTLDKAADVRRSKNLPQGPADVASSLDPGKIESIIGQRGQMSNGVLKIVIGRPDVALKDMGVPVDAFLGFNTWMAFQGTKDKAAVSGDFAMLENEVDDVIRELISRGIEVTAIHNHMVTEKPKIFFLHFWGIGSPASLAGGLRAALDKTGNRGKP